MTLSPTYLCPNANGCRNVGGPSSVGRLVFVDASIDWDFYFHSGKFPRSRPCPTNVG